MRTVALPGGGNVPVLGLGTWRMGERRRERAAEAAALKLGLDLGVTLIDTAEMYGEGGAEEVVAEATQGRRDSVFIVSKVYPHNASRTGTIAACERSLKRLRTDRIDLYLLHWPGSIPIDETVDAFEKLRQDGKIRHWGVSNFDTDEMQAVWKLPEGGRCAANQVLYNLARRGIEYDLVPCCRRRHMPIMAYSPLDQVRLRRRGALGAVARRHGVSVWQVALAWVLSRDGVIAIPKAAEPAHIRENVAALSLKLTKEDHAELDGAFPPPKGRAPLEMT